jgi:SAM-dependent methyltransferase
MVCLDMGCGGGDVTLDLARMVAPDGRVVGTDIDDTKLAIARDEAAKISVTNVEYRLSDANAAAGAPEFDVVFARFLLTHVADPSAVLAQMFAALRPGGTLVVEDIEFAGYFCYPESAALDRYVDLYSQTVRNRGGDPDIGPRLPLLLMDAGCEDVQVNVVQDVGLVGEVKLLPPLTMENIADAVLADELADRAEVDAIVTALYDFADDRRTVMSGPRIIQSWGRRPQR